jgi:hypothetical protein
LRHRSILEYRQFLYLKIATAACLAAVAAYAWHQPPVKPYGGTWLGYTLGTIGALLILWLMWFGVRKRRYSSNVGTVQGWLSAHVYLGTSLLVVATLHTGLELGWNVHTLAYALMVAVIASGFYGVFVYLRVPGMMTTNLGEDTLESLLLRISEIDRALAEKSLGLPDEMLAVVTQSIKGMRLGGGFLRILSGDDPGCPTTVAAIALPQLAKRLSGEAAVLNREVYSALLQKQELLAKARRNMRYKALLDLWLYVHVPLALALLAALAAHVVIVFLYW